MLLQDMIHLCTKFHKIHSVFMREFSSKRRQPGQINYCRKFGGNTSGIGSLSRWSDQDRVTKFFCKIGLWREFINYV